MKLGELAGMWEPASQGLAGPKSAGSEQLEYASLVLHVHLSPLLFFLPLLSY